MRLIDSCITQLKAQGPYRTCNESKEEEKKSLDGTVPLPALGFRVWEAVTHRNNARERESQEVTRPYALHAPIHWAMLGGCDQEEAWSSRLGVGETATSTSRCSASA